LENDHDNHHSTSSKDDKGKDDNDGKENKPEHDDGLSWYEQLCLSKISWNQEQLKMLGLNNKVYSTAAKLSKERKQPSTVVKTSPAPRNIPPCPCVRIWHNEHNSVIAPPRQH
jgi:hypothetical protein